MPGVPRIGPKRPIHTYIAARRKRAGLTQKQLGSRLGDEGVTDVTVSRWERYERGERGDDASQASPEVLAAIAEVLDCHVTDMFRPPEAVTLDERIGRLDPSEQEHILKSGSGPVSPALIG